jgi:hypothetical protein
MQPSKISLKASYQKMPTAMKTQLKSSLGIKDGHTFAEKFHGLSKERLGHVLRREGGLDAVPRSKIISHLSGEMEQGNGALRSRLGSEKLKFDKMVEMSVHDSRAFRYNLSKIASVERSAFKQLVEKKIKTRERLLKRNLGDEAKVKMKEIKNEPIGDASAGFSGSAVHKESRLVQASGSVSSMAELTKKVDNSTTNKTETNKANIPNPMLDQLI